MSFSVMSLSTWLKICDIRQNEGDPKYDPLFQVIENLLMTIL